MVEVIRIDVDLGIGLVPVTIVVGQTETWPRIGRCDKLSIVLASVPR